MQGNNTRRTTCRATRCSARNDAAETRIRTPVGASGSSAPNPRSRRISILPIIYIMLTRPESGLPRAGVAGPRGVRRPCGSTWDRCDVAPHVIRPRFAPRLVSGLASDPMRPDSTRRRLYRIEPPARSARVPPDIHRRRPPRHAHCSCSQCADAARCGDTVSSSRAHRAVDHPNDAHAAARTHPVPRGAATTDRPFSPLPHLMDNHRYP